MVPRRVVVITGANSGVGKALAESLLKQLFQPRLGAASSRPGGPLATLEPTFNHIVMCCRSISRGTMAKQELLQTMVDYFGQECLGKTIDQKDFIPLLESYLSSQFGLNSIDFPPLQEWIDVVECDLNSMASITSCCDTIKSKFQRIHSLVMNAGVIPITGIDHNPRNHLDLFVRPAWVFTTGGNFIQQTQGQTNQDGVGYAFACNTFGHYIMLRELESLLSTTQSPGSTVIYVSSTSAESSKFSLQDYQGLATRHSYESSKKAGDLMVMALNDQQTLAKKGIYIFSCSPGCVASNILQDVSPAWLTMLLLLIMRLFFIRGLTIYPSNSISSMNLLINNTLKRESMADYNPNVRYCSDVTMTGKNYVDMQQPLDDVKALETAHALLDKMNTLYLQLKK